MANVSSGLRTRITRYPGVMRFGHAIFLVMVGMILRWAIEPLKIDLEHPDWLPAGVGAWARWPVWIALGLGAWLIRFRNKHRLEIVSFVGFFIWWYRNPYFSFFYLGLVIGIYLFRKQIRTAALFLLLFAILLPKTLYKIGYWMPGWHGWLDSFGLALIILGAIYWWREIRNERVQEPGFSTWTGFFLFPAQPLNPINFGPADFDQPDRFSYRDVLQALLLISIKAATLRVLNNLFPLEYYQSWSFGLLMKLPWWRLWGVVLFNYFTTVLWLSGTADFVTTLARCYGWPLQFNYRWTLLAWNPVEMWRRWAIYNRKLLLKLVYFPLGGNRHNRYRNVLLTFLASAWVLHSGWVGSKYFEVGLEGWRDYAVYFLLQGAAVCACLWYWDRIGKDSGSDRILRWSWGRAISTLATQSLSAWLHILILCQVSLTWEERWRVMLRCITGH